MIAGYVIIPSADCQEVSVQLLARWSSSNSHGIYVFQGFMQDVKLEGGGGGGGGGGGVHLGLVLGVWVW